MSSPPTIRSLLRSVRPHLAATFGLGFAISLLMLFVPIYSMQVLDRVLSSGSRDTLAMLTLIVVVALVVMGVLQGLRTLAYHQLGRWFEERLAPQLVSTCLRVVLAKPEIGAQPLRDLSTVRSLLASPAFTSLLDAPFAFMFLAAIVWIDWRLGALVALGACVLLALAWAAYALPRADTEAAGGETVRALQRLDGFLRGAETICAMALEDRAIARWRDRSAAAQAHGDAAAAWSTAITSTIRTLRLALQVAVTGYGALLVIDGEITAGAIIAATILTGKALAPVDAAAGIWLAFAAAQKAKHRLDELGEAVAPRGPTTRLPPPVGRVTVEGLSWREPAEQRIVLRNVSLRVEPCQAVGVIGPSGSGKTSLARALVGVLTPSAGSVRLDGFALEQWDRARLGQAIGYLPQDPVLFEGTVAENIARLDPDATDEAVVEAANRACVLDAIVDLPQGFRTPVGHAGERIPPGMRQRIALARCFYGPVRVIVLDEPNAHLDDAGAQALARALQRARSLGITTISFLHRRELLKAMDRVVALNAGEIVWQGTPKELSERGARTSAPPGAPGREVERAN